MKIKKYYEEAEKTATDDNEKVNDTEKEELPDAKGPKETEPFIGDTNEEVEPKDDEKESEMSKGGKEKGSCKEESVTVTVTEATKVTGDNGKVVLVSAGDIVTVQSGN